MFRQKIVWQIILIAWTGLMATAQTKPPTYYQDIRPILGSQCLGCHKTGGIAPFSLEDPATVESKATLIAAVTAAGYMPPWMPGPDSPEFLNERKLTEAQKAILSAWAKAGAPLGEPR